MNIKKMTIRNIDPFSVIKHHGGTDRSLSCLDDLFDYFHGDLTETITFYRAEDVSGTVDQVIESIHDLINRSIPLEDYLAGQKLAETPRPDFDKSFGTRTLLVTNKFIADLDVPLALLGIFQSLLENADPNAPFSMPGSQLWVLTDICEQYLIPDRAEFIPLSWCTFDVAAPKRMTQTLSQPAA